MKRITILAVATIFATLSYAQNANDALRYSLVNYGGTARFMGLSGAYGAVGADFSALSQNPAGLGLFRRSEFTITPLWHSSAIDAKYYGNTLSDSRTAMYLGNVGYVMANNKNQDNSKPWKGIKLGFGMNRTNMLNNRISLKGFNDENSLLTGYMNEVNASGAPLSQWDNFGAGLAYDVNLFYPDPNDTTKWLVDMPDGGIEQEKTIESRGSTSETVLSAASNFGDKLYIGITFGFPDIRYEEESTYSETDTKNQNSYFSSFKKSEYLKTTGSGFNFKFGFIFTPVEFIRIGGAFHSPVNYYSMTDEWNATMTAKFDDGKTYTKDSPNGTYDYELTTPSKAIGSVAVLFGQSGLITADYEYVDYTTARLHANDYSFGDENQYIHETLSSTSNIRLGGEFKSGIYALRAGYSMYGSPYKNETTIGERTGYSFGIGVHDKGYSLDLAYNHMQQKDNYFPYSLAAPASVDTKNNLFSFTLGIKF